MNTILRWLHLSDIHFGHGDARHGYDQLQVVNALCDDLKMLISSDRAPSPDYVFITGDIAFSAAARNRKNVNEYDAAVAAFNEISRTVRVPFDRFLFVPGNHDVRRFQTVPDWFVSMNLGQGSLSLEDLGEAELHELDEREAPFMAFAKRINPQCAYPDWESRITANEYVVKILGWDTAVLANGQDLGRLQVRPQATSQLRHSSDNEVTILLTHHPFAQDWLTNERDMIRTIHGKVDVHLSGHIHKPRITQITAGDGGSLLALHAGAVHNDAIPDKQVDGVALKDLIEPSHTYSFGQLLQHEDGAIAVQIFPRRWHVSARGSFRWDVGLLPDHSFTATHVVRGPGRGQGPSTPRLRAKIEDLTGEVSHLHRVQFRDSLSTHLIDQLPSQAKVASLATFFLMNEPSDDSLLSVKVQIVTFASEDSTEVRCRAVSSGEGTPRRRVYMRTRDTKELVTKGENSGEKFKLDVQAGDSMVVTVAYRATAEEQLLQLSEGVVRRDWFCIEIGDLAYRTPVRSILGVCARHERISFRSIYEFRLAESRPLFDQLRPNPILLESLEPSVLEVVRLACSQASLDIPSHSECFRSLGVALNTSSNWALDQRQSQRHDLAYIAELTQRR